MDERMTLEQVRDNLRATDSHGMSADVCDILADALDFRLAQPSQAVDVGAVREVIARVAADNQRSALTLGVEGLRGQCIETAKELHKLTRAIGNAQAEGWSVPEDAAERLAQYIYEQEARERCKTIDEAVFHQSKWRRGIPEARKMLEVALSPTQATPNAHE